jgi:uncharacterized membrane protein YphA (DoxX/SURF4 family)
MNSTLWVVQWILALIFLASGLAKSLMSKQKMAATGQTGVAHLTLPVIRFIGISEILGAAALLLPIQLGVLPWLTPVAALGLAIIMVLAARIHWRLHEPRNVATNIVLLAACVFVIVGRLR